MKKKIGAYTRITNDFAGDNEALLTTGKVDENNVAITALKNNTKANLRIPKGWVPLTPVKWFVGHDNGDFINNMFTVMGTQFIIRAPRFMYNRYMRRKKYTKNLVQ